MATQVFLERYKTPKATRTPTLIDLGWAAGFLEGEGTFANCTVSAHQANPEPTLKLQEIFGGAIGTKAHGQLGSRELFLWRVHGARARSVMMTLFILMSFDRQQQIIWVLKQNPYTPPKTTCSNGHELSGWNRMGGDGKRVRCRMCHNAACLKWYHDNH